MESQDRLREIKKRAEKELMKLPGVTGVALRQTSTRGKETGAPAIIVYVENKQAADEAKLIPKEIEGVPTEVVQRTFKAF